MNNSRTRYYIRRCKKYTPTPSCVDIHYYSIFINIIIVFDKNQFISCVFVFFFVFIQADITCSSTKQSVGVIFTRTNFVTLKYVTDSWGTRVNGFRLIITAFKDPCKYFFFLEREIDRSQTLYCTPVSQSPAFPPYPPPHDATPRRRNRFVYISV